MWSMVISAANSGIELGEVMNATERSVSITFSKPSTASFTIRVDNPLLEALYGDVDCALQVWDGSTLRFHGICLTAELKTDGTGAPTVKVNAVDPSWELSKRIVGKDFTSAPSKAEEEKGKRGGYLGHLYSGDKGTCAKEIIELAAVPWIKMSATFASGSSGSYTAGPWKTALASLNDLANGEDGFDWQIKPIISAALMGEYYAVPVLGEDKSGAVIFEYGVGTVGNVREIGYIKDLNGVATKAIHLPDDLTTTVDEAFIEHPAVIVSSTDTTQTENARLARGGKHYEEIAEATGLEDTALRQEWVDYYAGVRADPRRVLSMTFDTDDGTGRVPKYGTDYNLGDYITARGAVGGITLFNGKVRIYQVNVSLNDNGTPTFQPILVDDEGTL